MLSSLAVGPVSTPVGPKASAASFWLSRSLFFLRYLGTSSGWLAMVGGPAPNLRAGAPQWKGAPALSAALLVTSSGLVRY